MLVIMLPKPEEMVSIVVIRSRPPATPMNRLARTMPMEALSLRTMMQNRMIAIAITSATISIAGDTIESVPFFFAFLALLFKTRAFRRSACSRQASGSSDFSEQVAVFVKGQVIGLRENLKVGVVLHQRQHTLRNLDDTDMGGVGDADHLHVVMILCLGAAHQGQL